MGTVKVNNLIERTSTNDAPFMFANAWVRFDMNPLVSIFDDRGVSSGTDQGVGEPEWTTDYTRSAMSGTCWTLPCRYSDTNEYASQKGGRITSTSTWRSYCGSNTDSRNDWQEGFSGITGKF